MTFISSSEVKNVYFTSGKPLVKYTFFFLQETFISLREVKTIQEMK